MLSTHFATVSAFVQQAAEARGRCLVHCVAGINRSGVLVSERTEPRMLPWISRAAAPLPTTPIFRSLRS